MNTIVSKRPAPFLIGGIVAMMAVLAFAASAMAQGPGKIAYVADFEIWMMEADGSGKEALGLAATDFNAYDVQLSPDGTWVAFSGIDTNSGGSSLFIMRAEAYDVNENLPVVVSPDAGIFKRASWHPGGRWLAYVGNDTKIYLVEVRDENGEPLGDKAADFTPEVLTQVPADPDFLVWVSDVAFAPDGRNLLVSQYDSNLGLLEVFDANGNRTSNVLLNFLPPLNDGILGRAVWPSFSSDGKKIVFQSIKQYTEPIPGTNPPVYQLINEVAIATLTIRDNAGTLTPEHPTSNPRQYVSKPVFYITPPMFDDKTPTWSPDGSKIVFVDYVDASPTGYKRIVSLNADTPEHDTNNPRVVLAGSDTVEVDFPSFAHPGTGIVGSSKLPAPVPTNLISWWPGENTAWDVAGRGDGSMKNSANEDFYDIGKVGRAFSFDGVDDHVQGESGGISLAEQFTIEVWVKPLSHSAEQTIVSKRSMVDDTTSYSLVLRNGKPWFRSVSAGIEHEVGAGNVTLPLGQWSHLAFTEAWDPYLQQLYLNGVVIASSSTVPTRFSTAGPVTIGAYVNDAHPTGNPGNPFHGLIDELSLYNKRALSGTEIQLIVDAGKQGKERHDPARDFSATANPNGNWRFGWIDGVMPVPGTDPQEFISSPPVPSYLTDANPDNGGLFPTDAVLHVDDITYVYGNTLGAHMLFNKSKTETALLEREPGNPATTNVDIAPRQFALSPAPAGDLDYSVIQWVVPKNGKYALSATFTGVEDSPTSTVEHVYHGDNALFIPDPMADPPETNMIDSFLGDGVSTTEELNLSATDTVTWIVGGGAAAGLDYTGLVASVVKLDDFLPFKRPEFKGQGLSGFKPPLMNGKTVRFDAFNGDRGAYPTTQEPFYPAMTAKLQYSATPGIPGSWIDLPGGAMSPNQFGALGFSLTTSSLPVGTFAFRVVTTVNDLGSTQSAPSEMFTVLAASTYHEVELDVSSASDPTGVATHRGDTLTYRVRFRNSGGLPAPITDQVQVMVKIPEGTTATAAGSTPGYTIVSEGGLNFARWTLTKPLLPVDPEPAFTVPVADSDMLLSDLHNLEVGDLVMLDSDGDLPSPLNESSTYEVFSVTTNQFKLCLPGTTTAIDIINGGTGTHRFERLWQTRTLKLVVADPTTAQETSEHDLDFGDILATVARITDRFHPASFITDSDLELTTIINPLSLTAGPPVPAVSPLRQGGDLHVDFAVKNEASYSMSNAFLRVQAPAGLTITGGFLGSNALKPTEDASGAQLLIFETGPLAPGASQICRTTFRVQYDLDVANLPFFDFDPEEPEPGDDHLDLRRAIEYTHATASTGRPAVTTYTKKAYTKKVKKVIRRPGKKPIIRFVPKTAYRLVPVTNQRNGIEANLEEEFGFEVQYAPVTQPRPVLDFYTLHHGIGPLPGDGSIQMVSQSNAIAPMDSLATTNRQNQILFLVTFQNRGRAPAEFLKAEFNLPDNSTYVAKSAVVKLPFGAFPRHTVSGNASTDVLTAAAPHNLSPGDQVRSFQTIGGLDGGARVYFVHSVPTPTSLKVSTSASGAPVNLTANFNNLLVDQVAFAVAAPTQAGNRLEFSLPYLDSVDSGINKRTLEFLVDINPSLAPGATISQTGLTFSSRDLAEEVSDNSTRRARVVPPAVMDYTEGYDHEIITDQNGNQTGVRQMHSVVYQNTGRVPATGVTIEFTYPQGLNFESAHYLDDTGRVVGSLPVGSQTPVWDENARTVTFEVGAVAATGAANRRDAGVVLISLIQNRGSVPTSGTEAYKTPVTYTKDDDSVAASEPEGAVEGPEEAGEEPLFLPASLIDFDLPMPATTIQGQLGAYRNEELTYQVTVMNLSAVAQRSSVFFPIPAGTEYVSSSPTNLQLLLDSAVNFNFVEPGQAFYDSLDIEDVIVYPGVIALNPSGGIGFSARIQPGGAYTVHFKLRLLPDAPMNAPFFAKAHALQGGKIVEAGSFTTLVLDPSEAQDKRDARVSDFFYGPLKAAANGTADVPNEKLINFSRSLGHLSKGVMVTGADVFQLVNGVAVVPTRNGNVIALSANVVANDGAGLVGQDGAGIVAAGGGNIVAGGGGNFVNLIANNLGRKTANEVLGLIPQIVAGGGGNLMKNEGFNLIQKKAMLVGQDGASLVGLDGASLVGQDDASIATLIAGANGAISGFKLPGGAILNIDPSNASLAIAAGVVKEGGARIVAAGGGNIVDRVGAALHRAGNIVAGGGGNVVAHDGAGIVAAGGGNIVAGGGGNIVAAGGGNIVAGGGGN